MEGTGHGVGGDGSWYRGARVLGVIRVQVENVEVEILSTLATYPSGTFLFGNFCHILDPSCFDAWYPTGILPDIRDEGTQRYATVPEQTPVRFC